MANAVDFEGLQITQILNSAGSLIITTPTGEKELRHMTCQEIAWLHGTKGRTGNLHVGRKILRLHASVFEVAEEMRTALTLAQYIAPAAPPVALPPSPAPRTTPHQTETDTGNMDFGAYGNTISEDMQGSGRGSCSYAGVSASWQA